VNFVEATEVAQEVTRELRKIDATNRQGADWARSVYGRRREGWVDNGGHVKPSKKSIADFAEVAARPIHGVLATLAKIAAVKKP
jgi:hypothetical protein